MKRVTQTLNQLRPRSETLRLSHTSEQPSVSSSEVAAKGSGPFGGVPCLKMKDGHPHPVVGYGTYKVGFIPASASGQGGKAEGKADDAEQAVKTAIELGYRFLDCAQFYGNEAAVGRGIQLANLPRSEIFLQSKVWNDVIFQGKEAVKAQVEKSLKDLQTDYFDLYLVHWPVPGKHVEAYEALCELKKAGKVRALGVSNYTVEDYEELMAAKPTELPLVNQIEVNPLLYRKKTLDFFAKEGVLIQAYRPLCNAKAFDNPIITSIAKKHERTTAQVLGRWCVQKGFVYMPKSTRKARMIENAAVFDFSLTKDEMAMLDNLTTPDAFPAFKSLYQKCVNRDTPLDGKMTGVKEDITAD